jgi:hypothetical protein
LTLITPSWSISLLPKRILSHNIRGVVGLLPPLFASLPYFESSSSRFRSVKSQSPMIGASWRPHIERSRFNGDSGASTSYLRCRRTVCRPRTSRDISSYSPPASLHFRYKFLQKVTTIMMSEGEAPKLIVCVFGRVLRGTFLRRSWLTLRQA